ncbi:MAG: HAD-IG family 5'-nucleotidase [Actinomycetota bacterium]
MPWGHEPSSSDSSSPELGVFANRTLNMRSVPAVGYDMDYTLIHYRVDEWEGAAFRTARDILADRGWPVADLAFDPDRFTLGLVFDLQLGNLVKASRFGYVARAQHGTRRLTFDEQRETYQDTVVELSEPRFIFMNTMFELSRADLFSQLVDIHDAEPLPGVAGYADLYWQVNDALSETHLTSTLKADIIENPDRYVVLDPDIVPTLQDQRAAGKQLLLITNSDWFYTRRMMAYAFDRFCPAGTTWRDLFDIVIVSANKPSFFAENDPVYQVVDEEQALLRPHYGKLEPGHVYFGGNAARVEESLGRSSGHPLYVGDHLFGDVHVTKDVLRWRTALIARELEAEIQDALTFAADQRELESLMQEKVEAETTQAAMRLSRLSGRGAPGDGGAAGAGSGGTAGDRGAAGAGDGGAAGPGAGNLDDRVATSAELSAVTSRIFELDERIAPLAKAASELGNPTWGPLMRAGNDKSLFARQVERYADVYMSRVSNLGRQTPFAYLRAARGSLPHDAATGG